MNNSTARPATTIIGAQYFLYFGVLGMFLPYFNLYCHHIGFTGFQIGALSAVRSVVLVIFPPLWGWLADRFRSRKSIYIFCHIASSTIWTFYLFTIDFRLMFFITIVYGAFYAPLISFLETFTMESLGTAKTGYGRVRAWGSISFIGIVVILGWAIDLFSIRILIGSVLAGSILMTAFSTKIPAAKRVKKELSPAQKGALWNARGGVFLFCAFLMLVSHGTYYGFFSIHLEALGYGKTFIGLTWAMASTAEILVMIRSEALFRRFSVDRVLFISFLVAAARWAALYFVTSPAGIMMTQVLHAVTYGTFHMASILYIDQLSPDRSKTTSQAVNNAVTYGLGLMVGFFLNGWLYERIGAELLFLSSGMVALTGGVIFKLYEGGGPKKV